jgi:hypothetical protein
MAAVKRYCAVPTSQVTFQNIDFYALADDSIRAKIVPLVLKHMAEFYVTNQDYAINANVNKYAIPPRAINMNLRSIEVVSTADPDTKVPLEQLNREDLYAGITGNIRYLIKKNGFYLEGNYVVLYPTPTQSLDLLRLNYFIRPNQLVDPSACGLITAINTGANQITCSGVPSTWTTANLVDLVKAQPGFDCTAIDQVITNINSGVITFQSALPTNLSVGDYVCLAGQSCVVQVPVELQPLLTHYVVVRVLAAQGDAKLKDAQSELEELEKNASLLLTPRVQGNVKRVVNARGINRWV